MIQHIVPVLIVGGLFLLVAWQFFSSAALVAVGRYLLVLVYLFVIALLGAMRWKGWL